MPEKKPKEVKISISYNEERETVELITIAPYVDRKEQYGPGVPEDSEVGAKAPIASKRSDFAIFAKSNDIEREEKESAPEEKEKGDAITIALPMDNRDNNKVMTRGEIEVGAMAASLENGAEIAIFAKKEDRMMRKQ